MPTDCCGNVAGAGNGRRSKRSGVRSAPSNSTAGPEMSDRIAPATPPAISLAAPYERVEASPARAGEKAKSRPSSTSGPSSRLIGKGCGRVEDAKDRAARAPGESAL
jgi:hypothetical protein